MTTLWTPTTEAELAAGITRGDLRENHYIEVKAQARNEQVAQTLASLAIDGGMFIIGIAEKTNDRGSKYLVTEPLPLEGWAERIDGIARNSIEPPLPVRVSVIPSRADPTTGYVVAIVAASPLAPHMTGGRYYGRGEASKHTLSDPEVLRHHERRQRQTELGNQLLDDAEANDYLAPDDRRHGHIYLVAEPLMPVSEPFVKQLLENESDLKTLINSGGDKCRVNLAGWYPTPSDAHSLQHRADGVAMVTYDASGPGRSMHPDGSGETSLLEIQLTETGGIRVLIGRGTMPVRDTDEMAVYDGLVVAYTQRLVYWVTQLSKKYSYNSTWTVGLRVNGIRGLRSYVGVEDWQFRRPLGSMDRDSYTSTSTLSVDAIPGDGEAVVKSLVGQLLKVLGSAPAYE